MSTKKKTKSSSTTNQTQANTTPFTAAANAALPGLTAEFEQGLQTPRYNGPFVARPEVRDRYAAEAYVPQDTIADIYVPDQYLADGYRPDQVVSQQTNEGISGGMDQIRAQMPQYQDTINNQMNYWNHVSTGALVDPEQNQYLQRYIRSMTDRANENRDLAINQINQDATSAGGYGNSNWARNKSWTEDRHAKALDETMSAVYYKNYLDEMDRRERAGENTAATFGYGMMPFAQMNELEANQRNINQQGIDNTNLIGQANERADNIDLTNINTRGMALQNQQQAQIDETNQLGMYDQMYRDNEIRNTLARDQAVMGQQTSEITNAMMQNEVDRYGNMDLYSNYFNVGSQIPGSTSQLNGTTNSTSTQTTSGLGPALSAIGAIGSMFAGGPLTGMAKGAGGFLGGLLGGGAAGGEGGDPGIAPMNITGYSAGSNGAASPWGSSLPGFTPFGAVAPQAGGNQFASIMPQAFMPGNVSNNYNVPMPTWYRPPGG